MLGKEMLADLLFCMKFENEIILGTLKIKVTEKEKRVII